MRLVFLGLSLSSSWGNGHATTYRSLLKGLAAAGHEVLFLERDKPWYASNCDLSEPSFCELRFYDSLTTLDRHGDAIAAADAVIIGSYVPEGAAVIAWANSHRRGQLCFYDIDTAITVRGLAAGGVEYITSALLPLLDLYLSFAGGPVLQLLRDVYRVRRPVPLYCSVDPELYYPAGVPKRWDLGYLGTYSPDRQDTLDRLLLEPARRLPDQRFVVAGPQYPDEIAWPANVERIEHLAPTEHAAFYSSMGWTLNVTRQDMIETGHSPSVRLFEATACGVPVLSDRWAGIEDVLQPDRDVLVLDDTTEIIEAMALPEDRRRALGQAGRDTTLRRHTGLQRAEQLLSFLATSRA